MEGFLMVIFLSITMLIGSFLSGMVPLTLSLSESKMRHITILGAGLLIGTALAVIIPEGVHSLYSQKSHKVHEAPMEAHHVHKRSIGDLGLSSSNLEASDREKIEMFLNQLSKNKQINTKLVKKRFDIDDDLDDLISKRSVSGDMDKISHFLNQIASDKNMFVPEPIKKRQTSAEDDLEARAIFDNQLKADKNMNINKVLTKRDLTESQMSQDDLEKYQMFLNQMAADKNMRLPTVLRTKRDSALTEEDQANMLLFLNQLAAEKNLNMPVVLDKLQVEPEISKEDLEKLDMFLKQQSAGRNNVFSPLLDRKRRDTAQNKPIVNEIHKEKDDPNTEHDLHAGENVAHSTIGITLVLGFIFMMFVDQIGGKFSHRPHQTLDVQSIRNKITFTTTLGLVVHSAADGVALGAAAATSKTDVEMIVFIAIMLHKAPASFGLVSFLIHEGLDRSRIRKHLSFFAMAAPIFTIITFLLLKSHTDLSLVSSDSTGVCMLFSAGTFLYVSTVHVLPEVQAHNDDKQFKFAETLSFIVGALMPLVLSIGHSH